MLSVTRDSRGIIYKRGKQKKKERKNTAVFSRERNIAIGETSSCGAKKKSAVRRRLRAITRWEFRGSTGRPKKTIELIGLV